MPVDGVHDAIFRSEPSSSHTRKRVACPVLRFGLPANGANLAREDTPARLHIPAGAAEGALAQKCRQLERNVGGACSGEFGQDVSCPECGLKDSIRAVDEALVGPRRGGREVETS